MDQVVEGGVLTGEKIKFKIKENLEVEHFKNSHSIVKRRHSGFSGSRLFPPRNGHHVLRRGRSMSIRIGCSDVVNGLSKSHEDLGTESEAVSSTISTDTEEDERSRTVPATIASNAVASGLTLTPKKVKKTSSSSEDSGVFSSISSTDSEPSVKSKATKSERPKLSKNVQQIEALLRRINEENKKTKEVLDNMGKSDQVNNNKKIPDPDELDNPEEDAKTKSLCTAVIPPIKTSIVEKTSTTFLDAYQINIDQTSTDNMNNNNENKANETPSKKSAKDQKAQPPVSDSPIVSYETSGEGRKLPIVIFNCNALSQPQPMLAGQKYHLTFKTVNADAKLISQICHAHGFHEVHSSNSDYNLMWTGVHPKPHSFKAMLPHQRVNHFPRSYELTRKDRLYQNIERLQHAKGSKYFNFVPKTFMIPAEYSEFAATHHRMRGAWIVKPVASSRGRGIFIVSHPNQVPLDEPMVVAKYIDNPLLVNGHKWDLRLYVAVTSYDPLCIYLYEEGLVRFATVRYDSSGKNLWNPCMHLCNYSINKYHSDYIKCDDPNQEDQGHKWSLSALLRHLKANGIDTVQLMQSIEDVIIKSIISVEFPVNSACKMFVPHRRNCFELYGFDILIDSDLKPWLLEVNLSPSLNCDTPIDMKIKSALLCDLLNLIGVPAVDPVLKRAQFNQKVINMTQQEEANRLRMSKRPVSMETRRFAAIRLAASSTSMNQELSRMIRNAREENSRRGGWVRVFPTAETWSTYGSMLEFSSPNNQILHEHLFPEATKRHQLRPPNYRKNATKNPVKAPLTSNIQSGNAGTYGNTEYRKRSQSAGPGREKLHETETESASNDSKRGSVGNANNNASKNSCNSSAEDSGDPESLPSTSEPVPMNRPRTSSGAVVMSSQNSSSSSSSSGIGSMTSSEDDITCDVPSSPPNTTSKPSACELRVAQYEKPLTKGHCPKHKSDPDRKDPEKVAKKRSERKERSHVLKEKIVKLIESGLQLSEYQARKAFSVYLHCILQRLSDFDDAKDDCSQIELVLKFLQKASLSLREPYVFKAPSCKLSGKDRAAIVAKDLNEFLAHYRRETEFFTVFREEQGMVPRHIFEEFIAFAHDSDLEDVLTLQTKMYRCAHIFLGKCLPPVSGRKNSLLRTAYGISPDRNLRDKQCSMRVNARANPPTAPQYSLPAQPPSKCLDISTTGKKEDEGDEEMIVVEEQSTVLPYKKKVEKSTNNANESSCM